MKKLLFLMFVLCPASFLQAAVLGTFDFESGMGASNVSPGVTISDLQYSSGKLVKGIAVETGASGSKVLKIKGSDTQGKTAAAFANSNYLFFTVTSVKPISLESITLDIQGFGITSFAVSRVYSDKAGFDNLVGDTIGAIGFKDKGDHSLEKQTLSLVDPSVNYLNGTGTTTNGFSEVTSITFYLPFADGSSSGTRYVEIDNLALHTIPEPASMLLLGLGGLISLVGRKKK